MLRSHIDHAALSRFCDLHLAGSPVAAVMQLCMLPRRITPGAVNVTEDDVRNGMDSLARQLRNDDTVDENLVNFLCGTLADFGWARTQVVLDPHVGICVRVFLFCL